MAYQVAWRGRRRWATRMSKRKRLSRAQQMQAWARDAGLPMAWVVGNRVYSHAAHLRPWRERQGPSYVRAVPRNTYVGVGCHRYQVRDLQAHLPEADWKPLVCGLGAKGPRVYDWQC